MPETSYQQAQDLYSGPSQTLNQVALGMARLRYMQAIQQQRDALALGKLALQGQVDQARVGELGTRSDFNTARAGQASALADISRSRLTAAEQGGQAMRQLYPVNIPQELQSGGPLGIGGPNITGGRQLSMGDLQAAIAKSMILSGRDPMAMHNVGPNNIAIDRMGDLVSQGPTMLNPGQSYQLPGSEPMLGQPRLWSAPAGSQPMQGTQPVGPQVPFRPVDQTTKLGNLLPEVLRLRATFQLKDPSEYGTNAIPPLDQQIYNLSTNVLGRAQQELSRQPQGAPATAAKNRVSVKSPDGQIGDIPRENLPKALQRGFIQLEP